VRYVVAMARLSSTGEVLWTKSWTNAVTVCAVNRDAAGTIFLETCGSAGPVRSEIWTVTPEGDLISAYVLPGTICQDTYGTAADSFGNPFFLVYSPAEGISRLLRFDRERSDRFWDAPAGSATQAIRSATPRDNGCLILGSGTLRKISGDGSTLWANSAQLNRAAFGRSGNTLGGAPGFLTEISEWGEQVWRVTAGEEYQSIPFVHCLDSNRFLVAFTVGSGATAKSTLLELQTQEIAGLPRLTAEFHDQNVVFAGTNIIVAPLTGEEPMTIQWIRSGQILDDSTNRTLTVVDFNGSGSFWFVASNHLGVITSPSIRLLPAARVVGLSWQTNGAVKPLLDPADSRKTVQVSSDLRHWKTLLGNDADAFGSNQRFYRPSPPF
jgi:hypothetical protein